MRSGGNREEGCERADDRDRGAGDDEQRAARGETAVGCSCGSPRRFPSGPCRGCQVPGGITAALRDGRPGGVRVLRPGSGRCWYRWLVWDRCRRRQEHAFGAALYLGTHAGLLGADQPGHRIGQKLAAEAHDRRGSCYARRGWSKLRLARPILLTMSIAATPVPLSEAKARLSELARRVRQQHERITLTRNGEPEAVLLSVDDLEGLEMTLEILGDTEAVSRISESLAALERGEPGADMATVRQDLARRRVAGT
jgi:antitoxin YefM